MKIVLFIDKNDDTYYTKRRKQRIYGTLVQRVSQSLGIIPSDLIIFSLTDLIRIRLLSIIYQIIIDEV